MDAGLIYGIVPPVMFKAIIMGTNMESDVAPEFGEIACHGCAPFCSIIMVIKT